MNRDNGPSAHESRLLASLYNAAQRVSPNNRNPSWQGWLQPPSDGRGLYDPVSSSLYFLISWILKAAMPSYLRTTVWTRSTRLTSSHQMMEIHQMGEVLRRFLEQYFLKASLMRTTRPRLLAPLNPSNYLRRLLQWTRQLLVVPSVAVVWILMKTLLR